MAKKATLDGLIALIDSLDWQKFHQVVLEKDSENWIEVGGSLKRHGLAAIISHNGEPFIIANKPASIGEMKRILTLYFQGDKRITQDYYFPGLSNPLPKRTSLEAVLKEERQRLWRRVLAAVILFVVIGLIFYNLNEQSKLLGKPTELARAEVVDREWKPGLMGYYLYRITYKFSYNGKTYAGITRAGFSAKRELLPGDPILIRYEVNHPENNAYEARIVKKHNRSVGNVSSRAIKEKMTTNDTEKAQSAQSFFFENPSCPLWFSCLPQSRRKIVGWMAGRKRFQG